MCVILYVSVLDAGYAASTIAVFSVVVESLTSAVHSVMLNLANFSEVAK